MNSHDLQNTKLTLTSNKKNKRNVFIYFQELDDLQDLCATKEEGVLEGTVILATKR